MKYAAACYITTNKYLTPRVLGVFNPKYQAWALPGGKVEPGESVEQAAVRELLEETGLAALGLSPLYTARGSLDPEYEVHVFQVSVDPCAYPETREPGNEVKWIWSPLLCSSEAFGPFYRKFFEALRQRAR